MISVKLCTLLCGIMSIAYGREEPDQEKHFTSPPSSSLEGLPDVEHTDKPVMESHNTAHMKLMSPPLPSLHNDLHQFHHNFTDVEGMFHNGTHLNTTGEHRFPFNNSESMPNHFIHGHQMMPNHSELHQNMSGEPHFEFNRPENYSHGIPPMPFHGMINHTELQLHHENMTFHNHSGGNETFIIPLPLRTIMPNLLPPTSVSTTVKPSKQPDTHPSNSGIVPPTTATKPSKQETLEAESDIFSCSDSCCQKFLNTTKCVFEKTANLSDNFTLNNEANADFRARIDQCFTR